MRRLLHWLGMAVVAAVWATLVRRFWFLTDDAYISFRYAKHWAEGEGLRYNLGDHVPVEGYSNFLWVALLRGVHQMGGAIEVWAPWLSAGCGLVLLVWVSLRVRSTMGSLPAFSAMLSLGSCAPFVVWSTGGLATMPFALCFYGLADRLLLSPRAPRVAGAIPWAVALALVRAEGIGWVGVLGGLALLCHLRDRATRRRLVLGGGVVLLAFGAYLAWKVQHFERWLPNTATAKVDGDRAFDTRGLLYVASYTLTLLTPLLLPVMTAVALVRPRFPAERLVALLAWGIYLYAVLVGGDFMTFGRFLVPALALHAWQLGSLVARIRGGDDTCCPAPRRVLAGGVGCAIAVLGALPLADVHLASTSLRERFHFRFNSDTMRSEIDYWDFMRRNTARRAETGRALAHWTEPGESLVCGAIGAIGYYAPLTIHDRYGLVDAEVAAAETPTTRRRSAGHDKVVPADWFLPRKPTYLMARVATGRNLSRAVRRLTDKWEDGPTRSRYAPLLRMVPDALKDDPDDGRHVLVLIARLPDGESPQRAWRRFDKRVQALDDDSSIEDDASSEETP